MRPGTIMEAWRSDYVKDAVADASGRRHWANVVREQVILCVVREQPGNNGYEVTTDSIAVDDAGNEYRYTPSIDYCGGTSWVRAVGDGTYDFFRRPPADPIGYVYPDGTGPVQTIRHSTETETT